MQNPICYVQVPLTFQDTEIHSPMVKLEEHNSKSSTPNHLQAEPIKTIRVNHCNVTLLGTAHVSKASADKVQELIATQKYDAVAVELCPSRHKAIVNPDAMAKMDLFQVIKNGQAIISAGNNTAGRKSIGKRYEIPEPFVE